MKIKVPNEHCKGCVWLINSSVCPFKRCIDGYGWIADKNSRKSDRGRLQ